jgi:hypothetical protein
MNDENSPPKKTRRSFLTMLGLAAVPTAGIAFGAKKQWLQNHGASPEDLAMESILARVEKHKPEGINPENALFVMGAYRDAIKESPSENAEAKKAAFEAVVEKINAGEIKIEPKHAKTIIDKYEKKLTELRAETAKNTLSYGAVGAAATAIAVAASASDVPSAHSNPSGKPPEAALASPSSPSL